MSGNRDAGDSSAGAGYGTDQAVTGTAPEVGDSSAFAAGRARAAAGTASPTRKANNVDGGVCLDSCVTVVIFGDSSAAIAVAHRRGCGKLRHINLRTLWLQEKQARGEVELRKVHGAVNPADLMTKYMAANRMQDLMRRLGQHPLQGRARIALDVQGARHATPP